METLASLYLIFVVFVVVVAILWVLMPFLIMGTNKRLDKLIAQNNELLKRFTAPASRP
jgi:hypothetical protein